MQKRPPLTDVYKIPGIYGLLEIKEENVFMGIRSSSKVEYNT